jgi:glycosyltransferase involved in cell wall biosynthesis
MEANMKKVLFMIGMMNIGGVEKSLLSLISVLPREKYDITILTLEKKGGFLQDIPSWVKVEEATWFKEINPIILQPPQLTIKEYSYQKKYMEIPFFVLIYFLTKYFKNRHLYYRYIFKSIPMKKEKYDIAISYQGPNDLIDFYIANKVKAKSKVSWIHFDVSKFKMNKKLYGKLYRKFDKLFVVSHEALLKLKERIPSIGNKAEVFLNIISESLISKMSGDKVNFDDDYAGVKVVTVGRLSKEKGQDLAIKALSRLKNEGYNVRWYCIGEGKHRDELERLIEMHNLGEDFLLMGSTTNPYPYIARSDIYVQTSRHEAYCLTLAEAKCLKKPIITTNFIGAFEQIKDGYNGLIVEADEEDLYEKIKYLIENPLQRERLSINLRRDEINTTGEVIKLINYV